MTTPGPATIFAPAGIVTVMPAGISSEAVRWSPRPPASGAIIAIIVVMAPPPEEHPARTARLEPMRPMTAGAPLRMPSGYLIQEREAGLEAREVFEEVPHEALPFVFVAPRGVRRHEAARGRPQDVVGRQRLGLRDVEVGGGEAAGDEGGDERVLIDRRAAADVVEDRPGLERRDARGVEGARRRGAARQDVDDVVGPRERAVGLGRAPR